MPTNFDQVNEININGNNYDRTRCKVEISVAEGLVTEDLTKYVKGIDYNETPDIQFDYSLGSRRPTAVGFGNITSEGTLSISDAGLSKLNEIAVLADLPTMVWLGQAGKVDITIEYTTYNGRVRTDKLEHVYMTNYNNGVNTDDVLYSRDIPLVIGKITQGSLS